MADRVAYLLGVVLVGWAVTYALRALPFLVFAKYEGELPPWVDRLGKVVSPVIIACLIVYSYAGLEWKTPWPYAAGLLTVALQVAVRNPLTSIVAGTALYMALLAGGCATRRTVDLDPRHPSVRVSDTSVHIGDEVVSPGELPDILLDQGIPKDRTIHIGIDEGTQNLALARETMYRLAKAGYTRPVLVTQRHAESRNLGRRRTPAPSTAPAARKDAPRKVRYRRADE